jgi:amidase
VARVRAAGAIVLAKSNMAEWAFSPVETVSSILPGYTKNPYALDRVTAGSSGGTAASIAASFGLVGFGSDTGDSIRGPSSHQSLAGIRSTMGLISRAGVFPLNTRADIAGPIARTMEDAVKVFQVIVGGRSKRPGDSRSKGTRHPRLQQVAGQERPERGGHRRVARGV